MAPSPSSSTSEPAIVEQVVTEFFAKSLHIILESRSPYVSTRNYRGDHLTSSSGGRPRDKWFNLALRDCPAALENFDLWRQSNIEPLVVDVIMIRRQSQEEFLPESNSEKIVERWIVQYETRKLKRSGSGSNSQSSEIASIYKKTYKRTIVLLRSLYSTVRLLPAYKVFRDLNSSVRICPFSLSHKISSFAVPFTRTEDAERNQFNFVPVDTPCGRLSLSVSYVRTLEDASPESFKPISAQLISDYVGCPTTDRVKRIHSFPAGGTSPTFILFTRRRTRSNDHGITPPLSLPTHLPDNHLENALPSSPSRMNRKAGCTSQLDIFRAQPAIASPSHTSSPESNLQVNKGFGEFYLCMNLQKILYSGKDEAGNLSGRKISSCTSPCIPSRRSSSRFSLLDEFDDAEFVCPFAVDEDLRGLCRPETLDADTHADDSSSGELIPVKRSTDAAVGALVRMLKTAAPLQQDFAKSGEPLRDKKEGASTIEKTTPSSMNSSLGLFKSRTAADALEELTSYRKMKELLTSRGGSFSR